LETSPILGGLWSYRVNGFLSGGRLSNGRNSFVFQQAVYEFGFETDRHPPQAFIFRAVFVNSKRFFSNKRATHNGFDETCAASQVTAS
jgi:hypothetical protein